MPEEVENARDVRWLADDQVLIGRGGSRLVGQGHGFAGIYSWRIGESRAKFLDALDDEDIRRLFAENSRERLIRLRRGYADHGLVGGSAEGGVAFAGVLDGVFVRFKDEIRLLKNVSHVGDIDRRNDMTVAIGLTLRTGAAPAENWESPWESHIAWLFKDDGVAPLGLLPTRDAGERMYRCAGVGLSVVRIISDERVLVVPGAEAGVFAFDRNGALIESLDAAMFSADDGCEVERRALLLERPFHLAWLSRRRVIDEVVADETGNVYFFVRYLPSGSLDYVEDQPRGSVCWDLVHAQADDLANLTTLPCAVRSERADARLRADLRGDRLVFLLQDAVALNEGRPAELFEARLTPPET